MLRLGGRLQATGFLYRWARVVVRRPWLVIGFWVVLAVALSVTLPQLTQVVRERTEEILPSNAPVMVATRQMTEAFHEPESQNVALVVLTDEHGLTRADEDVYRTLVDRLRRDTNDVASVHDFITTPALRNVMTSADHEAWFIPIGVSGDLGSPKSKEAYSQISGLVQQTVAGSTLTANTTGIAATVAELADIGQRDMRVIELATIAMVLLILLVVYRNPLTMLLPLLTIGVSLVTAQQLVAGLAGVGLGISEQTVVFMTAMMIGAGVDYAVFLISRYHEKLRQGVTSDEAVVGALTGIGTVIAASAATVAITFLGMSFTRLEVFSTVGPALAISISIAFLAAITLLPAILALAGRRGWAGPKSDLTGRLWRVRELTSCAVRSRIWSVAWSFWPPWPVVFRCCTRITTRARRCRRRRKAISAMPRWTAIFRRVRSIRSTSSCNPRTTCATPRH
ncbi:MMPL family transporter [Mycobacterium szulgai]|uniref:MMPL family transporter n=1 Tax=Mycobacterium szulgai TaxID=1787 RepID=UPI0021F2B368|nr:MMPL family transporter [Mycobacterium szulgai]